MLDSPEIRRSVLESLINQRVMAMHAAKSRVFVSDAQLGATIQSIPAFQEGIKAYELYLNNTRI